MTKQGKLWKMSIPVHNPAVKYKAKILGAMALISRPAAASIAPAMATVRHPNWLTRAEAIGPAQRVIPLKMDGMRETVPRPSPNASISWMTKMPKVYVIPHTEKNINCFYL